MYFNSPEFYPNFPLSIGWFSQKSNNAAEGGDGEASTVSARIDHSEAKPSL